MKSARELFEELGYNYEYNYLRGIGESREYTNQEHIIRFYSTIKGYGIQFYDCDKSGYVQISPKVIQAINQMVSELGWLDE